MTAPVKRYNMDVDNFFGKVRAYESEHGRWVKRDDYERLEREFETLRVLLRAVMQEVGQFELGTDLCDRIDAALQAKP